MVGASIDNKVPGESPAKGKFGFQGGNATHAPTGASQKLDTHEKASKTMDGRGSDAKRSDGAYTQAESVTDAHSRGDLEADPS